MWPRPWAYPDGVRRSVAARGERKPFPIVAGHGFAGTRFIWDLTPETSLARYLSRAGYDFYTIDLRGRGRAGRGPGRERTRSGLDHTSVWSERLDEIGLPLLIVAAAHDLQAPPEATRAAYEAIGSRDKTWIEPGVSSAVTIGPVAAGSSKGTKSGAERVSSAAPGVSKHAIVVGSLTTASGVLAGQFAAIVDGVETYFDAVDARGGVDGRTIHLNYRADDTGSSTDDTIQARNLVEQDHVFAVVGVGTPFFSGASLFAAEGTPVFGYVVSPDWNNRPNLFGAYGSYLDYTTSQPLEADLARRLHAKSVAVVAYNVAAQSEDACALLRLAAPCRAS